MRISRSTLTVLLSMLQARRYCSAFVALSPNQNTNMNIQRVITMSSRTANISLAASSSSASTTTQQQDAAISSSSFWNARQDCWRPDVSDVEKISFGMPAKKKRTGSRGVPHRLNEDERRSFDQARRKGFLEVTGSAWRKERSDAPLLNTYRSLSDARGKPMIVLHKLSPSSSGEHVDRLVVDLSPLRLPDEFEKLEMELNERILSEFDVESTNTAQQEDDAETTTLEIDDSDNESDEDDGYENRPIYQLSSYEVSWEVSRSVGKAAGKCLGTLFETAEEKATKTKKPKGVKPGKGRRHGGYGIG
jgi:hypothetical protein